MSRLLSAVLMALGGSAAAGGGLLAYKRMRGTEGAATHAVETGGTVAVRLTGYYPTGVDASEAEKRMEGGSEGAAAWRGKKVVDPATGKRAVLHTLEDVQAGRASYVSLSGDPAVWPWGQAIHLDVFPGITFRVVDTGGHFQGIHKVVRVLGREPLDVRVASHSTRVPEEAIATVVLNDAFGEGLVAFDKAGKKPTVAGGVVAPFAASPADREALARAIESSAPGGSLAEMQAIGWTCRNRATRLGLSVADVLAPEGRYGKVGADGRVFASTDRVPGAIARKVAVAVLVLPATADPTGGAVDFWRPGDQRYLKLAASARRTILGIAEEDDEDAGVLSAEDVRAALAAAGLRACLSVGDLELLTC